MNNKTLVCTDEERKWIEPATMYLGEKIKFIRNDNNKTIKRVIAEEDYYENKTFVRVDGKLYPIYFQDDIKYIDMKYYSN